MCPGQKCGEPAFKSSSCRNLRARPVSTGRQEKEEETGTGFFCGDYSIMSTNLAAIKSLPMDYLEGVCYLMPTAS